MYCEWCGDDIECNTRECIHGHFVCGSCMTAWEVSDQTGYDMADVWGGEVAREYYESLDRPDVELVR